MRESDLCVSGAEKKGRKDEKIIAQQLHCEATHNNFLCYNITNFYLQFSFLILILLSFFSC